MLWWIVGGLAVLCGLLLWRGAHIVLRPESVPVPDLPAEAEGLRIAVLSDLHDRRCARRLMRKVTKARPDVILLAGDMYGGAREPDAYYSLLARLVSVAPVLYAEGNHDFHPGERVTRQEYRTHQRRLSELGVTDLNGKTVPLRGVQFRGISWFSPRKLPEFSADRPTVFLCHDPLLFDLPGELPALTVSGHVHGGILKLPGVGAVFAPGNGAPIRSRFGRRYFFPKYSEGLYFRGTHCLAVSRGLGYTQLPIRFLPAEIPVLTLKKAENVKNS